MLDNKRTYTYSRPQRLTWDEAKRVANLQKHGLDFVDAGQVLGSALRMDVQVVRAGEPRTLSVAWASGVLATLVVVHTDRAGTVRVISFRRASRAERLAYAEWLEG